MNRSNPIMNNDFITALVTAMRAGHKINTGDLSDLVEIKNDGSEIGFHGAVLTRADLMSQDIIFRELNDRFPQAYFLTEESDELENSSQNFSEGVLSKVLNEENYVNVIESGDMVFGVDSLDGSSQYNRGRYEFSSSIGIMKDKKHTSGAIFAPRVFDGLLVGGIIGMGAMLCENLGGNKPRMFRAQVSEDSRPENTVIDIGIDLMLYPAYRDFLDSIVQKYRTINTAGSCALGLALVASGKSDALIQPIQGAWDWFGGYPIVEEAGGKIQFYKIDKGDILFIDKLEPEDYHPKKRMLGFIAGNPSIVETLTKQLSEQYKIEKNTIVKD